METGRPPDPAQRIADLEAEVARLRRFIDEAETRHVRTVRQLELSEEKFAKAFHASPDAVNLTRLADGCYLAVNHGFTVITGWTPEDVLGRGSVALGIWVDPADRQRLAAGLAARGAVDDLVALFRRKDGSVLTGSMTARLLEVGGERCVLSITRDLTERLRAEAELRQSEERARLLVELAVDGILLGDASGRISGVNQRACELLGRPREELLALHISRIFAPDSLEERPLRFDLLAVGATVTTERDVLRPDGARVPVEMNSRRMPDGTYHAFLRDLTGRKRAEAEHAAFLDRLRQAERTEAIGRLAGGVAHDFNNLLTPILTSASTLLEDAALPAETREEVEVIQEAAGRAAALTRQILAFSRRQVLRLEPVDLNAEIARTEGILRRLIGEDVRIRLSLAPALPPIHADLSQVQQVLLNLALNARDAMPDGGGLEIRTLAGAGDDAPAELPAGRYARLLVADTGTGMAPETIQRAFEPFFTTKAQGRGTGLGLPTVKGIVEQHGGALRLESAPGEGTTFTLWFPLSDGVPLHPAPAAPQGSTRGTGTILLAEDEAAVRSAERRILEAAGYTVVAAADGEEALRLAARMSAGPDLLVTDVVMPGMSGRQLYDRLRERLPGLPVLFVSGYPDSSLGAHGVLAPGTQLLSKPFTAATLSAAVHALLAGRPAPTP